LGALFAPDGVYADELFGAYHGRTAIAAISRYRPDYRWDFIEPASDGATGYARKLPREAAAVDALRTGLFG
jgi:hypothetical protein